MRVRCVAWCPKKKDLELLDLPGLVELEACLQTSLGRVADKRQWAVYHLLQQQETGGQNVSGGKQGASGSPRQDPSVTLK